MTSRTRAERTSHSKHFEWIESFAGGEWVGRRANVTLMKITAGTSTHEGIGRFELVSRLDGQLSFPRPFATVEEAQKAADAKFEQWVTMMGLSFKS